MFAGIPGARAQSTLPVKQGLWETQTTVTNQMSLPPDLEAKIAAMPAAQQAMVRQNMGGKPTSSTIQSCIASQATMDQFLNSQQQRTGMKCTFTNRQQTATGTSFDTSCTMQQGTAAGHSQFTFVDDEHVTGQTHMTVNMTSAKGSAQSTIDSTMSMKYVGADCGSVKPNTTAPVN
jgi:hypothetical protein